jgi:hypothetical protein
MKRSAENQTDKIRHHTRSKSTKPKQSVGPARVVSSLPTDVEKLALSATFVVGFVRIVRVNLMKNL